MKPELLELLPNLVLFVGVARARSFSRAARALDMPVSTISRRVAELEARVGVQLLTRTTRNVQLTAAGGRYFERCLAIVEAAQDAQAELSGHAQQARGQLRISATPDFAITFLTPMFGGLARDYPELDFEIDLTPRSVDLVAERFDVAIRMGELPDSQLVARKLGASPRALYAAPEYLQRKGPPRTPRELAGHDCVRLLLPHTAEQRWTLDDARGEHVEVAITGRFVVNNVRFLVELAASGMGIVAVDVALARPEVAAGRLVRVLPGWSPPAVPVHALTPGRLLPARTTIFLDRLKQHLEGLEQAHETTLPAPKKRRGP